MNKRESEWKSSVEGDLAREGSFVHHLLRYPQYIQAIDFVVRIIRTYLLINNHHMMFNIHTYIYTLKRERSMFRDAEIISDKSVHGISYTSLSLSLSLTLFLSRARSLALSPLDSESPNAVDRSYPNLAYRSIQDIHIRSVYLTAVTAKRALCIYTCVFLFLL